MLNTESYSKPTASNQSQEFTGGDLVEDNLYTMPIIEDNQSMQCIQLVLKEPILDKGHELEAGAGKEYQNVMMETEHETASLDTGISFIEDVQDSAL